MKIFLVAQLIDPSFLSFLFAFAMFRFCHVYFSIRFCLDLQMNTYVYYAVCIGLFLKNFTVKTDFVILFFFQFEAQLLSGCSISNESEALAAMKVFHSKGGLISERFSLWLNSPKKVPNHDPEHYPRK